MEDTDEIRSLLNSIAQRLLRQIDEKRSRGVGVVQNGPYYRFSVDCDLGSLDHRVQRAEFCGLPEIDPQIKHELLSDTEHLDDIARLRDKVYSMRGWGCVVPVSKFEREILNECLFSDNSSNRISEIVEKYSQGLVQENPQVRFTAYLSGILIKERSVRLASNVSLRNPVNEDFEETVQVGSLTFDFGAPRKYLFETGSVLEVVFDSPVRGEGEERITTLIEELRIYFKKPIQWVLLIRDPSSFYDSKSMSYSHHRSAGLSYAEPDGNEHLDLIRFINEFDTKFEDARKINHVKIATEKYSGALLSGVVSEEKIADAIMGLEALFFKSDGERSELDYRLQLRIAKLMSLFSFEPISVRQIVKKAYHIRSVYAHGNVLSENDLKKIVKDFGGLDKILEDILEYLRLSLLSIVLNDLRKKDAFVKLIEDALIDENSNQDLKEKIQLPDYVLSS